MDSYQDFSDERDSGVEKQGGCRIPGLGLFRRWNFSAQDPLFGRGIIASPGDTE